MFEHISKFEQEIHNVDLGGGYLNRIACSEMIHYISKSKRIINITEPLNTGKRHYYSLLSDGSSNAKTMDEKELVLIKTCTEGVPKFDVLGLQEVIEGDTDGICQALDEAVKKGAFLKQRQQQEIGLCTDGAAVNVAAAKKIKSEVGEHYLHTLCPAHKVELAVHDAFNKIPFNAVTEKDLTDIYYFFKKANLKWRLFKRQGIFMGMEKVRYKRPSGTRWVEHQLAAINAYLKNLPILIGFLNQQISEPHNTTMRKAKAKMQGLEQQVGKVENVVFMAVKADVLQLLVPLSKVLQDNSLITPELFTVVKKCTRSIHKMIKVVHECGASVFKEVDKAFPTASKIITELEDSDIIVSDIEMRSADKSIRNTSSYYGFRLRGDFKHTKGRICTILESLETVINERFSSMLENPIFKSMALFLDTSSYESMGQDTILAAAMEIVSVFKIPLEANGCKVEKIDDELDIMYTHTVEFISRRPASKAWKMLFSKGAALNIHNVLHIAEICIVSPLGNAEAERIFSLLWRLFSKERSSLNNLAQENLLRLRGTVVSKEESAYAKAMELFLSEYPDGSIRKRSRRTDGHTYPKKRKSKKKPQSNIQDVIDELVSSSESDDGLQSSDDDDLQSSGNERTLSDIDIGEISDDEEKWSSSSDDEL